MKFLTLTIVAALGFVGFTQKSDFLDKAEMKMQRFARDHGIPMNIEQEIEEALQLLPEELGITKEELQNMFENIKNRKRPSTDREREVRKQFFKCTRGKRGDFKPLTREEMMAKREQMMDQKKQKFGKMGENQKRERFGKKIEENSQEISEKTMNP